MEILQAINQIAIDPAVRSGRAYITGTGVTVADVAMVKLYHQQDADGIADWYGLTLPQVYAALAYYYEHKTEIDLLSTNLSSYQSLSDNYVKLKQELIASDRCFFGWLVSMDTDIDRFDKSSSNL